MSKSDKFVFTGLHIVAWIIFVGLCINAGGLIVNFFFSVFNPSIVDKLYNKLDLSGLYAESKGVYFLMYGLIIAMAVLKSVLIYQLVLLLMKIDLQKPFNAFVSQKISRIGALTITIAILSIFGKALAKYFSQIGMDTRALNPYWENPIGYILMAAVIFAIAAIFKRGLELQNENDLTV